MASAEHLKILRRGVEDWNQWRMEHLDVRPDLVRANLSGANLSGANLSGANLSGVNLSGAKLQDANLERAVLGSHFEDADDGGAHLFLADLSGANLQDADLTYADLHLAFLERADLARAYLFFANLSGANLQGADLFLADLPEANLTGVNLSGANLSRAKFGRTAFADIDLRQVKGLESVQHNMRSNISTSTLECSRGQIQDAFLRGCGLSDWQIESARLFNPDLTEEQITTISYEVIRLRGQGHAFFSAFISYAHEDQAFARALHDQLQGRGIRCWLDERQVLPGDDIYDSVDRGIRLWDKVLLVCSEASLNSWWVGGEIDAAFEKERQLQAERGEKVHAIILLDLDRYIFDGWKDGRAPILRRRLAADFTGWRPSAELAGEALARVVAALRADSAAREPEPEPKI